MEKISTKTLVIIAVIVVVILIVAFGLTSWMGTKQASQTPPQTASSTAPAEDQAEASVRDVVTTFGSQLQKVSLLAPNAASTMEEFYGPYVSSDLLAKWEADPSNAPGRQTSSPWPNNIQVTDVSKSGDNYIVRGQIVFMTSNEVEHGGVAGLQDVTMTVSTASGTPVITDYTAGQMSSGGAS
ncbi:MAG TPA: hypothetical protein VHF05_00655 [Candidatus Paceibacterota bacterium]|jgi:hypothetical protein|nr:hypothetical protein [Candidatus Paceibacterota bacterium]